MSYRKLLWLCTFLVLAKMVVIKEGEGFEFDLKESKRTELQIEVVNLNLILYIRPQELNLQQEQETLKAHHKKHRNDHVLQQLGQLGEVELTLSEIDENNGIVVNGYYQTALFPDVGRKTVKVGIFCR